MKLRRVEILGFKSFGKKTVLEFPEGISAIVGPNGSGKCVTGDTKVLLADGSSQRIDEMVDSRLNKGVVTDDGWLIPGDGTEVVSLGDDLRVHKRPIKAFVKRTAPKELIHIRTRAGREVTTTPYHPLFTLHEGKVKAARADALAEGVRIAIPREVGLPEPDKLFVELLDLIKVEDELYVPHNKELVELIRSHKGKRTWKVLAKEADLPYAVLKGLADGQSINFSHCVRLLRALGIDDKKIISWIPAVKAKNHDITKIPWKNTPRLARMFGYLLAEGRSSDSNQIWFTNGAEEIVQDYFGCITEIFGIRATINEYKSNAYDVIAYSQPAQVILEKLGIGRGGKGHKDVTDLFFKHAGAKEISELLNGLYCGDGYIGKSCIEITIKGKPLADAIESALLRLGIVSRRKTVIKTASNSGFSGTYEKISFYDGEGFRRFGENVKLVHKQKSERLEKLLEKIPNPNVDLIEVNDIVKRAAHEEGINIKKSREQFPKLDAYAYNTCLPSRTGVRELVQNVFGESQSSLLLQQLCTSHIFWDEISSIERMEPEDGWVYDLCVEEDHNFIANNIFVHNSNVVDSICFALGYPSRNLRANRVQELIHSGKGADLPHARVAVTFQDGRNALEVRRKVDRKGKSTYKLNSVTTGLDGLHDTLSKYSIPKDGFNIVMQNDVMKFIEIKPVERRKLLDRISGISGYEEKKKRSLDELGIVERRISDTNLILSEKKGYLEEIGKDREIALKYQDMQDELRKKKSVYYYSSLYRLEKEEGETEKRLGEINREKESRIVELARIDGEIDGIGKKIEGITKRIVESSGGERGRINGEIGALKSGIEKRQEEIQFLKDEMAGLEEKRAKIAEEQGETKSRIGEMEGGLRELAGEIKKVEGELVGAEEKREQKAGEYDNSELIELDRRKKELSEEVFEARRSISLLEKELDMVAQREGQLEGSLSERMGILKSLRKELVERDREIKRLGDEAGRIEKLLADLDKTTSRLSSLFQEFARVESEIKTVERMEARMGESEALKTVLKNKEGGYIGIVRELGRSPDKYGAALEVAAGRKSNCLVVKDDKAAEAYIEELRKNKVGRATFLPLNKVHGPELKPVKGNGIIGFARDLIKCDKRYQKVFDFVFGETLVVRDIEAARRVGIGKMRMVTLKGDLIAGGGAMTGGYYRGSAATFSSTEERRKKLDSIRGEIESLEKRKGDLERQLEGRERINVDVIREKRANLAEKEGELKEKILSKEADLKGLGEKRRELEGRLAGERKAVDSLEGELRAIEGRMNMEALTDLKEALQEIDSSIESIRERRFELREREAAMRSEIGGMQNRVKEMEEQANEIDKSLSRYKNKIEENITEISKAGKRLSELEEKNSLATKESQGLFKEQERLNQLMGELGEKRGALEAAVEKLKGEAKDLEVKKAKADARLEDIRAGMGDVEKPSKDEIKGANLPELKKRIRELERELGEVDGVNLRAVEMYDELERQYGEIREKNEKLHLEKEKIYDLIETIEERKRAVFYDSFQRVKEGFSQIVSDLYPGTEGNLSLENDADPFNSGLILEVKPRGREGMTIDSLSGGEKALVALAFLMSTQSVSPSPFYILDEVDASLDQENVLRLISFLKNRRSSQFILISHNPETVKHVDSVIGVHMQDGLSKTVGVDMQMVEA